MAGDDSNPFMPNSEPPNLTAEADDDGEVTLIADLPKVRGGLVRTQRRAYLIVLAGSNVGAIYRLNSTETHLGRSQKCEICLTDTGISRKHAKLTLLGDSELLLEDRTSTNGTFVDDKRVTSIVLKDGDRFQLGSTTLLKFSVSDELEEKFQRRLYESSVRDGLTGLHNRKHFDEQLESEFGYAIRHGAPLSLILIDIDHFKRINDTYGHQAGDEVLRQVTQMLQDNVRSEDLVARYGGEEFAVIARGISASQAYSFANRIRSLMEQLQITVGQRVIQLTISAGVSTFENALFPDSDTLLSSSDKALYAAKATGRNRVVLADECQ